MPTPSSKEEYEKAVLWVPDPASPAGWIRRKVWAPEEESQPRAAKRPMGFAYQRRRAEEED